MTFLFELVSSILLIAGASFGFLAGVGLLRMQDVFMRMHAATKAGAAGTGLVLLAVAVHFATFGVSLRVLAAFVFLLMTAPIAAHMIARAAYKAGIPLWEGSVIDEWEGHVSNRENHAIQNDRRRK